MTVSRRSFMHTSAAAGLGIALVGSVDTLFGAEASADADHHRPAGYGPLIPDPAGLLALPAGFSYALIAEAGVTTLDSGEPTPSDPDGTASFPRRHGAGSVLVNNH